MKWFPLLVFVSVVFWSGSASAAHPAPSVTPPDFCADSACSRGLQSYELARFEEAARAFEAAVESLPAGEAYWQDRADLQLMTAAAWDQHEEHLRAGMAYLKASRMLEGLRPHLEFRAARSLARASDPPLDVLESIVDSGALKQGFAGSTLLAARLDALASGEFPDLDRARAALQSSRGEESCRWISSLLVSHAERSGDPSLRDNSPFELADSVYGHCLEEEVHEDFADLEFEPSAAMRARRADRLYGAVRFDDTRRELDAVSFDDLDAHQRCRAQFRDGRTWFRLKERSRSIEAYQEVIDDCTDPENEDERVRALYAVSKMLFGRKKHADSERGFESLLDEYPERSHADDAILYLARIARGQNRAGREKRLVERAVADYPEGDMLFEIVWEYVEKPLRRGDYKVYLKRLEDLDLRAFDEQYYSQGRLEYFTAYAWEKLGRDDRAAESWREAWERYPFSFYGYLSRQRLVAEGETPASLEPGVRGELVDWFQDAGWRGSKAQRLVGLGLYEMAAEVDRARLDADERGDGDRWRLAYLEHLAGRYPVSHNIARRTIDGSPWVEPATGRRLRWQVAWPNPFEEDILRAVTAERRQASGGEVLEPALPASIMREESSFIEDIESWAGALGLMQLMPRTALAHDHDIEGRATPERLKTSLVNIRVGVDHLFSLARRFDSHPVLMAAAYNAGGGAVSSWLRRHNADDIALFVEDIPYDEARNYSKRVMGSYAAYQWLSGIKELDPAIAKNP